MGIEEALEAYERAQERLWELEQERKRQEEEAAKEGAQKWAREFLAIDCELAADKVHMLELIDREKGTELVEQGLQAVFKMLAIDAAGGEI